MIVPLSPEARALAADPEHVRAARGIARGIARRAGVHPDPIESAAMLALVRSAGSYHPARGIPFSAWCRKAIRFAILHDSRDWSAARRAGLRGRGLAASPIDPADSPADPAPSPGEAMEAHDAVEALLDLLPARHRAALRLVYLDCRSGGSPAAIAAALGVSKVRAYQIHAEALEMLRRRVAPHLAGVPEGDGH